MGFIDASLIDAKTINKGTFAIGSSQNSLPNFISTPSSTSSDSIFSTVNGGLGDVNNLAANIGGTATNVAQTVNVVAQTINRVQQTAAFISNAVKSLNGTLSPSTKALATGISGNFQNVFTNKNLVDASNTTRKIGDPVTANLLGAKSPLSGVFAVNGLTAGSTAISLAGATSKKGSGDGLMVGTQASTLMNRFNLDSPDRISQSASSSLGLSNLSGLFSTIKNATAQVRAVTNTVQAEVASISNVVVAAKREYDAITGVVKSTGDAIDSLTSISSLKDFNQFLGDVQDVSFAVDNANLSSFYLVNSTASLINQTGAIIETYGSGVDPVTANAILDAMSRGGCKPTNSEYRSANSQLSLFNTSLNLAARYGMGQEIRDLLGCSTASTTLGQQSITTAFSSVAGSQIDVSTLLLKSVTSTEGLYTQPLGKAIVTNPNLTEKDKGKVDDLFALMGTSPIDAFTVPATASSRYPIFDAQTLISTTPAYLNSFLGDTTISDYFNSVELKTNSAGALTYA
jgi:hypothetical protein